MRSRLLPISCRSPTVAGRRKSCSTSVHAKLSCREWRWRGRPKTPHRMARIGEAAVAGARARREKSAPQASRAWPARRATRAVAAAHAEASWQGSLTGSSRPEMPRLQRNARAGRRGRPNKAPPAPSCRRDATGVRPPRRVADGARLIADGPRDPARHARGTARARIAIWRFSAAAAA